MRDLTFAIFNSEALHTFCACSGNFKTSKYVLFISLITSSISTKNTIYFHYLFMQTRGNFVRSDLPVIKNAKPNRKTLFSHSALRSYRTSVTPDNDHRFVSLEPPDSLSPGRATHAGTPEPILPIENRAPAMREFLPRAVRSTGCLHRLLPFPEWALLR